MSFAQFVQMLLKEALFFTRIDALEDKHEGALPSVTYERNKAAREQLTAAKIAVFDKILTNVSPEGRPDIQRMRDEAIKGTDEFIQWQREWSAVSCWHMNAHESVAMWRLYMREHGVAVRSTYARLASSLGSSADEVYIGCVKYLDYDTDDLILGNALAPLVCKRRSFAHECELRAMIWLAVDGAPAKLANTVMPLSEGGKFIDVDLDVLVHSIYVNPGAPGWFRELVQEILSHVGRTVEVHHSSLERDPLF